MGTNNGNHGKKGRSGRKNSWREKADFELLEKIFFEKLDKEEVMNMLKSGKYSIKDVMVSKAFGGNERFIQAIFNKLFPDNFKFTGKTSLEIIFDEAFKKTDETSSSSENNS